MTTVVKKLVTYQKGIISVRSAVAKKKEELMALKLEELKPKTPSCWNRLLWRKRGWRGRPSVEHPRAPDRSPAGGHHLPEWGCEGQAGDPNGREAGHAAG
jgi:hypothetical protein